MIRPVMLAGGIAVNLGGGFLGGDIIPIGRFWGQIRVGSQGDASGADFKTRIITFQAAAGNGSGNKIRSASPFSTRCCDRGFWTQPSRVANGARATNLDSFSPARYSPPGGRAPTLRRRAAEPFSPPPGARFRHDLHPLDYLSGLGGGSRGAVVAAGPAGLGAPSLRPLVHARHGPPSAAGAGDDPGPCKGAEFRWRRTSATVRQDYPDYEITFVRRRRRRSGGGGDPPRPGRTPGRVPARLLVAGRAAESGQKVHNLRAATAELPPEIRYLVFVDSDARPRPEWLRSLIAPAFRGRRPQVATGYRWFTPERPSLAHKLVYSINSAIMSLLGRSSQYMVWGGSWAIRRDTFEAIGLRAEWKGTLSDDLVAAAVLRQAKRRVAFQPACVVVSPLSLSLGPTRSAFIRRQYLIARHYADFWWLAAVVAAHAPQRGLAGHADGRRLRTAPRCAGALDSPPRWAPCSTGWGRIEAGSCRTWRAFIFPSGSPRSRAFRRFAVWAAPLGGLVEWLVLLSTVLGRCVVWRGIRYRLLPRGRIEIERREGGGVQAKPPACGRTASQVSASLIVPIPNP